MQESPKPIVTIVMAAFNRENCIERSIQSVLDQTFEKFELIIVDDGSTDRTATIAEAVNDHRVRVVRSGENRGVSHARNIGVARTRGSFIAFQDSDDVWTADFLERHLSVHQSRPEPMLTFCQIEQQYPNKTVVRPPSEFSLINPTEQLLEASFISTQTFVAPASAVQTCGGFDESLEALVDWDLMIRLSQKLTFAFINRPMAIASLSENSLTRQTRKRFNARNDILEKHSALFADNRRALARQLRAQLALAVELGQWSDAFSLARSAVRAEPMQIRNWATAARVIARRGLAG